MVGQRLNRDISALKGETTFETAEHTQTMAAAKAAIQKSRDSLHGQELKRITFQILAATKRTILTSHREVAANPTKLRQWNLPLRYGIQRCIASSLM